MENWSTGCLIFFPLFSIQSTGHTDRWHEKGRSPTASITVNGHKRDYRNFTNVISFRCHSVTPICTLLAVWSHVSGRAETTRRESIRRSPLSTAILSIVHKGSFMWFYRRISKAREIELPIAAIVANWTIAVIKRTTIYFNDFPVYFFLRYILYI